MSISSILFRGQPEPPDNEPLQAERPSRSLRRMLKPWPLPPALPPSPATADDDEDDPDYREPTPPVVLDRLAKFAARR